ncbi:BlaI/MecI/CopY family transcriptional regulator [Limibacter armeniacum]|uniref:BlaI/MecI/CopY family transcriptional regulator n=1 Tax=Limibacter armeniacum TaxID=466084 RepID=UPI002FE63076
MKELTKAEEQIMQVLWKLDKAFLKDIVEKLPEPRPAYTTVSTVIRVLVKKQFIGFNTYGKVNEYYPAVSKEAYFKTHFSGMVKNFFNNSLKGFASFFAGDKEMDLKELEEIKSIVEQEIEKRKAAGDQ